MLVISNSGVWVALVSFHHIAPMPTVVHRAIDYQSIKILELIEDAEISLIWRRYTTLQREINMHVGLAKARIPLRNAANLIWPAACRTQ